MNSLRVPSIVILKFLSSTRNYSGWTSSKLDMFVLYVSDVACEGFLQISSLLMCVGFSSSNSTLMRGTVESSTWAYILSLTHGPLFMVDFLFLLGRSCLCHM